jgi:putative transcriptional regulator
MSPQPLKENQRELLKKLGDRVQQIRSNKGLTLEEVGKIIGKDRQSVHRLEKGKFNPSYLYLVEICKGLEIDISELLKDLDT